MEKLISLLSNLNESQIKYLIELIEELIKKGAI